MLHQEHIYPLEFINHLNPSGFLPQMLRLKVGACIMLLKNLDARNGHRNGTWYTISHLDNHIIDGVVATGNYKGKQVLNPHLPLVPRDNIYPFNMKKKQFLEKAAFVMIANRGQGHTLTKIPTI